MVTELVHMGATELIQLGDLRYLGKANTPSSSPVVNLFRLVDYMENPFAGIEIEAGESVSAKQRAIAQQLQTVSRIARKNLVKEVSLGDYSYSWAMAESMRLAAILNEMGNHAIALGKFKVGKKLKKVAKKVVKVVKSPAFLSVVGVAANLIPGVGQAASSALLTTAGTRAKIEQEKKARKEMKKAEAQAAREAAQQDEAALNAYYQQYHVEYLVPLGYTPEVWSKFSLAQKRMTIEQLAEGKLQPYVSPQAAQKAAVTDPVARQQVIQTAALSQAMHQVYGDQLPGEPIQVPSQLQPEVNQAASEYQRQIMAVGKDNFLATAQKAVGQAGAINALYKGLGSELPSGMNDVFDKAMTGMAFDAGVQDVKNSAAAVGVSGTVDEALSRGTPSEFPWVPVVAGVGGAAAVATLLAFLGVFD